MEKTKGRSRGQRNVNFRASPIHSPQSAEGGSRSCIGRYLYLPSGLAAAALRDPQRFRNEVRFLKSKSPAMNPRWYGFNLLEYFSTDADWMKYFPYKNDGMFLEDDFRWIRDWGFNWVRLPMDYRFWTGPDLFTIDEKRIDPIDRLALALTGTANAAPSPVKVHTTLSIVESRALSGPEARTSSPARSGRASGGVSRRRSSTSTVWSARSSFR